MDNFNNDEYLFKIKDNTKWREVKSGCDQGNDKHEEHEFDETVDCQLNLKLYFFNTAGYRVSQKCSHDSEVLTTW